VWGCIWREAENACFKVKDGVGSLVREWGGWTFVARERMWLKYGKGWGWWGGFIHGPVARNGEGVYSEKKGVGVG
jgi:hypothetical protein